MRTRRRRVLLFCRLLPTCGAYEGRPQFYIHQPDELRADALGAYGNTISKTPNFDKFAQQATVFEQAHTSYTVCTQSRVAFMTGWPTHVRGHRTLWSLLHDWEPNLLKYFKQKNYTVKWWGKNDLLAHDAFPQSVTSATQSEGRNNGNNPYNITDPRYYIFVRAISTRVQHHARLPQMSSYAIEF